MQNDKVLPNCHLYSIDANKLARQDIKSLIKKELILNVPFQLVSCGKMQLVSAVFGTKIKN